MEAADLSAESPPFAQQLWLSELKKRKMKGLRQEFDTMETPVTELKVLHQDWEHLRYALHLLFLFLLPSLHSPRSCQNPLPHELVHHVWQVGHHENRDYRED